MKKKYLSSLVIKQKIEERDNLKKEYISKEKRLNELKSNLSKLEAEFEINSAQIESLDNNYLNLNEDYNKLIKNIEEIKNLDNQEIDYQVEEKNINLKKKTLEDLRNKNLDRRLVLEDLASQLNFYKNTSYNKNHNTHSYEYICYIKSEPVKVVIMDINKIWNCFIY